MSKKIMLVCSAGMSTSLLVTKMEAAAKEKDYSVEIFARPVSEADQMIEKGDLDAILLGPQVRFMLKKIEEKASGYNVPVSVIDMADYGLMNGEKVLNAVIKMIENGANK